jgi:hypothetical protein
MGNKIKNQGYSAVIMQNESSQSFVVPKFFLCYKLKENEFGLFTNASQFFYECIMCIIQPE